MENNSNGLSRDYIAIDTNVFGKIAAANGRILELLKFLMKNKVCLLLDEEGRILREYMHHLKEAFREQDAGDPEWVVIMRHWMKPDIRIYIDVKSNKNSELRNAIFSIIPTTEYEDATFVCVAFIKDRVLITNDHKDILSKRDALKRIAERSGLMEADVISSEAAHAKVPQSTI